MAERTSKSGKKVVQAEEHAAPQVDQARVAEESKTWKPAPGAKSKAVTLRVIALILWVVAIALELVAIFWLLKQTEEPWFFWVLIGTFVVIGALSIIGSQLWKKANTYDPARKSEKFRFFVQNQLGAIIALIAFLPLIILVFLNKDMDSKQKGIAGGVGIGVLIAAVLLGISYNPPSVEDQVAGEIANEGQVDEYTAIVEDLTGADNVTWTKEGNVYHLCSDASAVNLESADNQIYAGTVEDAHAAGKAGLTLQVEQELTECSLAVPDDIDTVEAEIHDLRDTAETTPVEPAPAG